MVTGTKAEAVLDDLERVGISYDVVDVLEKRASRSSRRRGTSWSSTFSRSWRPPKRLADRT